MLRAQLFYLKNGDELEVLLEDGEVAEFEEVLVARIVRGRKEGRSHL